VAQLSCSGGEVEPVQRLQEVVFSSGTLQVTWTAFETYVDYWGTYDATPAGEGTGRLSLQAADGNYVPDDIDGEGTFRRCGDDLYLIDIWLGSPRSSSGPAQCGHRLQLR
jgi:hypothetical protein